MPYIKQERRTGLDHLISWINTTFTQIGLTGNLNYVLYRLAKANCTNYASFAAFIGELESAKLEIYRKLVAPYEEQKESENGSIE